jgi:hypothetical protein
VGGLLIGGALVSQSVGCASWLVPPTLGFSPLGLEWERRVRVVGWLGTLLGPEGTGRVLSGVLGCLWCLGVLGGGWLVSSGFRAVVVIPVVGVGVVVLVVV